MKDGRHIVFCKTKQDTEKKIQRKSFENLHPLAPPGLNVQRNSGALLFLNTTIETIIKGTHCSGGGNSCAKELLNITILASLPYSREYRNINQQKE